MVEIVRKVYALLSRRERIQIYWILPAITMMALMQVGSIVSIFPFFNLVTDPSSIQTNKYASWAYETLNFQSDTGFLIFTGLVALFIIVVSNAFTAYTTWLLLRFSWGTYHSLSERLLTNYLYKPYVFFLNRNSSDLGKNVLEEVSQVVRGLLVPGMQMLAKGVVAIFILALLVVVNPWIALGAFGLLGSAYALIFVFVRRKLSSLGKARVKANKARFHASVEALAGVKEIKLLGKETVFIQRYAKPSKRYTSVTATTAVIGSLPSYALEAVAFGGILILVLYMLAQGRDVTGLIPLLAMYGLAIYRLMPALQQIFTSIASIKANTASLDVIYEDLLGESAQIIEKKKQQSDRRNIKPLPFTQKLELRDIHFQYPESERMLFQGFNLEIKPNTSVAFVGSTGSGKTTTVDIILGLLKPEKGQLLIDGQEITEKNLAAWQMNIGYVPQSIYLNDDTVAHNIAFGVPAKQVDFEAVERAAKLANIHDFVVNDMPQGYDTFVGERGIRLSGGQRQRLGIARALYHNPSMLVLDEATSALDGVTEEAIFHAVNDIGKSKTVIMIAHRISTVRECDVIYVLDRGRIAAQGTYDELMATSEHFRAIAQVDNRDANEAAVAQ